MCNHDFEDAAIARMNMMESGNTGANIINGGFSVRSDESIYFMNYADNNNFYSINTDGTGRKSLINRRCAYVSQSLRWLAVVIVTEKMTTRFTR